MLPTKFTWHPSSVNFSHLNVKPLSQMKWNLVGSIYGRSSIKIAHFVPIRRQTWPPQAILVSDWLIWGPSKDASYQVSVHLAKQLQRRRFVRNQPIRNKNYGRHRQFLFLIGRLKKSSLKPLGQMNRNLVGSIYDRSSLKIAHFLPICYQTWPPQTILVFDWLISRFFFRNQPFRNKNCLWWPCLLTDQN
jgi:hypothetical protein